MPRRNRSLLAQLRFGILPLRIETGRFKNIKDSQTGQFRKLRPEERVCEICKLNVVEDEIHFICQCNYYSKERDELYDSIVKNYPEFVLLNDQEKFKYLLLNECKLISEFLAEIWTMRSQVMFN